MGLLLIQLLTVCLLAELLGKIEHLRERATEFVDEGLQESLALLIKRQSLQIVQLTDVIAR